MDTIGCETVLDTLGCERMVLKFDYKSMVLDTIGCKRIVLGTFGCD